MVRDTKFAYIVYLDFTPPNPSLVFWPWICQFDPRCQHMYLSSEKTLAWNNK